MAEIASQINPANSNQQAEGFATNHKDGNDDSSSKGSEQCPASDVSTLQISVSNKNEKVSAVFSLEDELGTEEDNEGEDEEEEEKEVEEKQFHSNSRSCAKRSPRLASTTRTIGFARAWAKKVKEPPAPTPRVDPFLERLEMTGPSHEQLLAKRTSTSLKHWVVDPSEPFLYRWQVVVFIAVLYNWIFIIARAAFRDLHERYLVAWLVLDYTCDIVYILDMAVQFRTGYLEKGILVHDLAKLKQNYMKKISFKLDCLSIIPLDFFYLIAGTHTVALRLPRLLRANRVMAFSSKTETRTRYPNLLRIFALVVIVLIIFHWNACIYFVISTSIGLGSDKWVYPNLSTPENEAVSHQYLFSLYWSARMLTTGESENPPETNTELLFVLVDLTVGFLVFAAIVGQFGSIIIHMMHSRREFLDQAEEIKRYMEFHGVGKELQHRVVSWFDYMWSTKQSLDQHDVLSKLPDKLRAEIAVNVHLETLKRVQIFADCDPGLLKELVLKLRSQVFSPGDFICRKGDLGREMFIVNSGRLQVMDENGAHVIATLNEGSYFGEISLLNLTDAGNRRTANVRSMGFSDLLCLSKEDLLDALKEYPDVKKVLEDRVKKLLRRSEKRNMKPRNSPSQ